MLNVIFFSLIGGVFSLIGGLLLLRNKRSADGLAKYATPFAAGVLLAAAFTDLLPEALHEADTQAVLTTALCGLLGFFFLERYLRFFHHHHEHGGNGRSSNLLIIIGDTLHNALDGVAIGAAFLVSPGTGVVATLAVALHEIPQEIGDFGLMLKNGMQRKRVVVVNILSALATTLTAVITYGIGDSENSFIPYLLAITAGFFIYIASSDIIPEIHEELEPRKKDIRPWLLLFGALFVMLVSPIAHDYIDNGHDHDNEQVQHTVDHLHENEPEESHEDEDHNH